MDGHHVAEAGMGGAKLQKIILTGDMRMSLKEGPQMQMYVRPRLSVRVRPPGGPAIIDRPRNGNGDGAATCTTDLFVDS